MKAFVVTSPGDALVRDWTPPTTGEGEVLVAPALVGVCGTDLELVDGTIDPAYVRYPLVLGHEWVGRLVNDVSSLAPAGTPVVVEGVIPCHVCDECLRGATNRCATYDEIGFTRPGALAQLVSVPIDLVHPLADGVALDDAVLVEPMAVVWRALTRVPLRSGLDVAIVGDGTIALLSAHMVQLFDPSSTTVVGRRDEQSGLASQAGADHFEVTTPSQKYELVIEASGSVEGVATALELCARGGMVILLGLTPHGSHVSFAPDDLVNNDMIIQGSFSYTQAAFIEVVRRVNTRELRPSFLITHRFSGDDASDAIDKLRTIESGVARGKVVIAVEDWLSAKWAESALHFGVD